MAHEYVKISELEATASFGTTDQFVIVQDEETVKIDGAALIESLATLTNLATRSYVDAVVDSAPGTLDTLRELAAALNDDSNFGASVTALINEKLPAGNFGLEFWNQLATVNSYHIQEGSNLYWTQDRFDTAFASKNTYHLVEGSNLYFTEQRVLDVVTPLLEQFSPVIGDNPVFNSVTTTQLNVQNVTFTGTGAVNIFSGNDLNLSAAGNVTINGQNFVAFSGNYNDLLDKPTNPTYNSVIISGAITNPSHATTKAYVDWKLSSMPTPSWNSLVNISNNLGPTRIALGRNAGGSSDADGYGGYGGYGAYGGSSFAIAIGNSSGKTNQGGAAIGIGVATGYTNQGESAIAIGLTAGNEYQGSAAVAIGASAGNTNQGVNSIAIGSLAGKTNQPAGSIVINASGNELNGTTAGLFVDPIRYDVTAHVAYYNPESKEVTYGPAPTGGGAMSPDPVFNSVTATDLNVQNVNFTGTGAVTINSNNDLNFAAAGDIKFNGEFVITKTQLKLIVASSIDFADFKARIAAL